MDPNDFEDMIRQQNIMFRSVAQENETDLKIKLMDIINSMVTDRNRKVQRAALLFQAQQEGLSESEADRVLDLLIEDNMVITPEPGYVKRA
jgi:hypothetical protein